MNDRPHLGHVYTTTLADVLARFHRLAGRETFFLTGTDEHAGKVVEAAEARGLTPRAWADANAAAFRGSFERFGIENDDFIRTSEARHIERVKRYLAPLLESGDVYPGEYEGWYDAGQEEYVADGRAAANEFRSPVSGRPLLRRTERNYFFRLSAWAEPLLALLEAGDVFDVAPAARKNEVIARVRDGLDDVPISRAGFDGWGVPVPGEPGHTVYVWIDALCNYLSAVDTDARRHLWPADVHLIAKDILWFHAVIWPALLLALGRRPGLQWVRLPRLVYAHSFWVREGAKMSKSLGNFVETEHLSEHAEALGVDAVRWFLATRGPLGTADGDFSDASLIAAHDADLANGFGNAVSRVAAAIARWTDGRVPAPRAEAETTDETAAAARELRAAAGRAPVAVASAFEAIDIHGALAAALELVREVDRFVERTAPFRLAKEGPARRADLETILHHAAEALRIASLLLWPAIPAGVATFWGRIGRDEWGDALADRGRGDLACWASWGGFVGGEPFAKGPPLFPRAGSGRR